jgi:hypothetical protein
MGTAVLKQAVAYDVPIAVHQRIEDRRQRHLWDGASDLEFRDIGATARAHPQLRLMLLNQSWN